MKYIQVMAVAIFFHLVLNIFMPWWNIFFAGLIAGYFSKTTAPKTWWLVFLGILFYWMILLFKIDHTNQGVFSVKLAQLLHLENKSLLLILNSALGGICAACGSLAGFYLKKIVRQKRGQL
jgi:hypothetical protein